MGPDQEADWEGFFKAEGIKTGYYSGAGRRCVFDVEGDGLLYAQGSKKQVTQLWCIAAVDIDTGEEFYWGVDKGPLEDGLAFLAQCDLLVGHNAIGYDFPALERLYPWWKRPAKSWDSLVVAKAAFPAESLMERDMALYRSGRMPGHLLKRHSLEAWGHRTGTHKGDYRGGFDGWCPAMAIYLMGDIRGNLALWKVLTRKVGWTENDKEPKRQVWPESVIETECKAARIIHEQWECGVAFDMDKAQALAAELRNAQASIEAKLVAAFGSWWEAGKVQTAARTTVSQVEDSPTVTIKRYSEKTGKELKPYVGPMLNEVSAGAQFTPITYVTFTPSNRHHLAKRLIDVYGWKPQKFGDNGAPTVDESTLEEIPEAVLPAAMRKLILDYFVVSKTFAMLFKGKKSWISMAGLHVMPGVVHKAGRIHGEMDTIGAITRRAAHKNPNLGQVPSVKTEKGDAGEVALHGLAGKYGWECRELYTSDVGWELTGVDASSLELILLGHYLHTLDAGQFSQRVCDPTRDPHAEHAQLCGMLRRDAKTTIYLKVYGGSAYKLSLSLTIEDEEIPSLLAYKGMAGLLTGLERRFGPEFVQRLDDRQKAKVAKARIIIVKLEKGITGLAKLIDSVKAAAERGWLKGMDGSTIVVRKPHAALNSLLQSAGAMACKLWMVLLHEELERRGLKKGVDWKQVLWLHDEYQFTHRPGIGPAIAEAAEQTLVKAGEMLGLRGRFRTSAAHGLNWASTH